MSKERIASLASSAKKLFVTTSEEDDQDVISLLMLYLCDKQRLMRRLRRAIA